MEQWTTYCHLLRRNVASIHVNLRVKAWMPIRTWETRVEGYVGRLWKARGSDVAITVISSIWNRTLTTIRCTLLLTKIKCSSKNGWLKESCMFKQTEIRINTVIFLFCVSRRICPAETYRKRLSSIFLYLSEMWKRLFSSCVKGYIFQQPLVEWWFTQYWPNELSSHSYPILRNEII